MKPLLLLASVLLGAVSTAAAADPSENMASAELFARAQGRDVRVAVRIEIERKWHIFHGPTKDDAGSGPEDFRVGTPTTIELAGSGVSWGDWRFPVPYVEHYDFGEPTTANLHKGTITIWRRGTLAEGATLGALKATLSGQTCEDGEGGVCVPYDETVELAGPGPDAVFASFPADLGATPAPVKPPESARAPPGSAPPAASGAAEKGAPAKGAPSAASAGPADEIGNEASLLAFLLSAVFWGLFTLLMPCTYPMIPITISYFTKQASQRKTSTLPLSLAYGLGIVLIFVLIGVLVGPIVIAFAAHPVTNLVIGVLFLVFALTLFGVLNLQPPAFLMSLAGSASQKGGYLGVFFMGATLVITSFTCTAPFVGALLGQGAGQGDIGRIALGMAVFGLTMAVPFVFLSMVPGKVKAMPKSGEWMHTLKVWLGFVEVAAALKFLSNADLVWGWNLLSRELFLWLWAGTFLVAAAYLFAWIRIKDEYGGEDAATISPKRLVWGTSTFLFAVYCVYGAAGGDMDRIMTALIPPYSNTIHVAGSATAAAETSAESHVIVEDDFQAAVARAKAEKKLVLVNFTGVT
jgi:thiol:disulfide interchange protein DsbD